MEVAYAEIAVRISTRAETALQDPTESFSVIRPCCPNRAASSNVVRDVK